MNSLLQRIETTGQDGKPNGHLFPIWHMDDGPEIGQVYVTVVAPGSVKGPHQHNKRRGLFACVSGKVRIVQRTPGGQYDVQDVGEGNWKRVEVPAGNPAMLQNIGEVPAILLNMPNPPWREHDQDEIPVEGWDYQG